MTDERKESEYKRSNEILINNNSSIKHTDKESVSSTDKKKSSLKINSRNHSNQITNQISLQNFEEQKQSSTLRDEINSLKNSQRISNNSNKNQNNIQLNKVTKYKKENAKGESKVIPNRDSIQISKEDNIEQVEINNDINCRQRLTRFLELHDRLFYIKLIIYILSFASFVYYVVCTYINSLFSSLNYYLYYLYF